MSTGNINSPLSEGPGTLIGRYKLLEKVGEGGFGAVYAAEQREPVNRRVALKIIKLGMDTKEVVARFEAERQALAMMDHPNIARVLDAGATESGRPFFVMELVRGIKITEYCDQNNLPAIERLKLFIQVCHAVQHAHQKGIIHRDLKPSNILVTLHDGVPVPKVIDFGIAKATQFELTEKTIYTQLHEFIGTPAYMSPEQAEMSGLDIDTRSDIYSLGVLLYELLTSQTPFDAKELIKGGLDEIVRTIREVDPPRPSTRLNTLQADERTTAARRRGIEAPKLFKLLRGDLDWIVMKCLEKDRTRRYETASGVAADLRRFLENEPVVARPPSRAYLLRKFVRRNKAAAFASAAVLLALLGGLALSTYAFFNERDARLKQIAAEQARGVEMVRADAVSGFIAQLLQRTVPNLVRQGNPRAARALLKAADQLGSTLSNAPPAQLALNVLLASSYAEHLGDYATAVAHGEQVAKLMPAISDDKLIWPRDKLRTALAAWRLWAGQGEQARNELNQLYKECLGRNPPASEAAAKCLFEEGLWSLRKADADQAVTQLRQARNLVSGNWDGDWKSRLAIAYAQALALAGDAPKSEQIVRECLQGDRSLPSPSVSAHLKLLRALTHALCRQLRFGEAEKILLREEVELSAANSAPEHLVQVRALRGAVLARSGKGLEALPILVGVATNRLGTVGDWCRAVMVAAQVNDSNTYRKLCHMALMRYVSGAEQDDAFMVAWGFLAQPQEGALLHAAREMLGRLEAAPNQASLLTNHIRVRIQYRAGEYADALNSLNDSRATDFSDPLAEFVSASLGATEFLRAAASAYLDKPADAREFFRLGLEKLGPRPSSEHPRDLVSGEDFVPWYEADILRREAEKAIKSKGIKPSDALAN